MNTFINDEIQINNLDKPKRLFPLIRQISYRVSPKLAQFGFSPNQLTMIGLFSGIACAFAFAQGTPLWGILGALLWTICSLMDYCDGEVARITNKTSNLGRYLDDLTDWIVHTAFFLGLGVGAEVITKEAIWFWFGVIAAAGTTINSWMNWLREWLRHRRGEKEPHLPGETILPTNPREQFLYIFRGLFRADFWVMVVILELFHATWLLLPVFAIGVQVYWLVGFIKGADQFIP